MPGNIISVPEVTHISAHGFWLLIDGEELSLAFDDFPWFRDATVGQISQIERPTPGHLYWPALDIDLALASVRDPAAFPLVAKAGAPA